MKIIKKACKELTKIDAEDYLKKKKYKKRVCKKLVLEYIWRKQNKSKRIWKGIQKKSIQECVGKKKRKQQAGRSDVDIVH